MLEDAIKALTVAVQENTAALKGAKAATPTAAATPAATKAAPAAAKATPAAAPAADAKMAEARAGLKKVMDEPGKGANEVRDILARVGAAKLSDVKPETMDTLLGYIQASISGTPASAPSGGEDMFG